VLSPTGIQPISVETIDPRPDPRADLGGKSRWYHFQWAAKSVITRPSGGMTLPSRGYVQIAGYPGSNPSLSPRRRRGVRKVYNAGGAADAIDDREEDCESFRMVTPPRSRPPIRENVDSIGEDDA